MKNIHFSITEQGELNEHGERTGLWKTLRNDGIICSKQYYKDGVLHGVSESYQFNKYDKTLLYSLTNYVDGKLMGLAQWYFKNGKIKDQGIFLNDNFHGIWEEFYYNGKPKLTGAYNNDMEIGVWELFSFKTGEITERVFFV